MIGFIGLGVMGTPMARNLARSGTPLVVWSRSSRNDGTVRAAGARVAASAADVFARSEIVLLMLSSAAAIDAVLERNGPRFTTNVSGRIVVNMGTNAPGYSRALAADVNAAGGGYVEAPVSGSQRPAESGDLIAMLAGSANATRRVRPLLGPMCRSTIECGAIPNASLMKQAVNIFLITMVTGLAEAAHYARRHDLDLKAFADVLAAGPMASSVSGIKAAKLLERDFSVQASVADVVNNNTRPIADEAREAGIAVPLLFEAHALFSDALALGYGESDMAAVVCALEARSRARGEP